MRHALTLFLLAATAMPAAAQLPVGPTASAAHVTAPTRRGPESYTLRAVRTDAAIRVDGRLDEPAWGTAPAAGDFVQASPKPGAPASERTEVRVLYTDKAIYIGARLYDSEPGAIAAQLARRDAGGIYSDWLHVVIDSYHDRRTAFRFSLNPRGVKKDVLHYDDGMEDTGWDAIWEGAATMDAEGWVAEYEIPLSQLRFSAPVAALAQRSGSGVPGTEPAPADAPEMVWGLNFRREIARRNERSDWAPIRPEVQGYVSQFGELHGISGISAQRQLELTPYTVAGVTRAPEVAGSPYWKRTQPNVDFGADLKYGLTSSLTLSATLNPDFGQVDADPSEMNLSAYESFFREQRPFFVEGSNIFNFGIGVDDGSGESLFYSRRIGRTPQRGGFAGPDEYVDAPETTTILGAAKLSGKTARGWSLGFLDAVTQGEEALVSRNGVERAEPIEPWTNYAVARVARDFRKGRSSIGAMGTAVNRDIDPDGPLAYLRDAAYTGGVDVRHRFLSDAWEFSGWVAGSIVHGSTEAMTLTQMAPGRYFQRPDADHIELDTTRTSLAGMGATGWLSKVTGHWRGGFGAHTRSPGFEPNDAGFMSGTDQTIVFGNLNYRQYEPGPILRQWSVGVNPSASWDWSGMRRHGQLNLFGNAQLNSFWGANLWTSRSFGGYSPDQLRGGPAIVYPGGWRGNFNIYSDSRKPVTGNFGMFLARDDDTHAATTNAFAGVSYRPSGRLELTVNPTFSHRTTPFQYVKQIQGDDGTEYIFGSIAQNTLSLTSRMSYAFTPELSLQLYAQPFVSAGDYADFKRVSDPHATLFRDRVDAFTGSEIAELHDDDGNVTGYAADADGDGVRELEFGNPDFNFRQLRSNLVLRWQYRPGSALFLVWSHGRTESSAYDGSFDFGRDFGRLLGSEAAPLGTNRFLVKASYWLDW